LALSLAFLEATLEGLNFFGFGIEGEMNLSKIRTIRATYERKLRDGSEQKQREQHTSTREGGETYERKLRDGSENE
jgi:hypothetical protein